VEELAQGVVGEPCFISKVQEWHLNQFMLVLWEEVKVSKSVQIKMMAVYNRQNAVP
jgi:hypothetical protein